MLELSAKSLERQVTEASGLVAAVLACRLSRLRSLQACCACACAMREKDTQTKDRHTNKTQDKERHTHTHTRKHTHKHKHTHTHVVACSLLMLVAHAFSKSMLRVAQVFAVFAVSAVRWWHCCSWATSGPRCTRELDESYLCHKFFVCTSFL